MGGYQPEASVHTRALREFAFELHRRLGTRCEIILEPDITRSGFRAADLLNQVERGDLELCYFASSYLAPRVPSLGILDLPFAVTNRTTMLRQLDDALGTRLAADVAARTGYRLLAFWDNGFRHVSNRFRPLRTPEDCRGLRLRTLDSPLHQRVFSALGFTPVIVDVKDLARAVAEYEVDAQENPLTNFINFGLYRTHRYLSLTAHLFGVALLIANRTWFDALDPSTRREIRRAADAATTMQRGLAAAEDERCLALLRADGVAVVPKEEIDQAAFRRAVSPLIEQEAARFDRELWNALADGNARGWA
jgi:TRAP-type C4-dicarboxylate transport system substrate-binding protein